MEHSAHLASAKSAVKATSHKAPQPASMRRVAAASFVGTLIEFYDFSIYGFAAALVFGRVFFPALGSSAGTIAAFATFGVAFVARPLGAILFGHYGDKLGRKKTLIVSLLMMGTSTFLVGLMPETHTIGIAAPLLLAALRIFQGLAAGGEWAGAVLFSAERAPVGKRGFWAMFASLGAGAGIALAPATFLVSGAFLSEASFLSWGWRIPFLTSLLLLGMGMWIRLSMDETPVFKEQEKRGQLAHLPIKEAFRCQFREIALAGGMMILTFSFGYLGVVYLTNYGTSILHLSRTFVLGLGVLGGIIYTFAILVSGLLSDRIGRRRTVISAIIAALAWSLVLFPILGSAGSGAGTTYAIAVLTTMFLAGAALGPMSAYTSELFETRFRYTAVGFSYNLAGTVGGAITPIVASAVTTAYGGHVVGYILVVLALISLACVLRLKETQSNDLNQINAR